MKVRNGLIGGKGQTVLGKMCGYQLNGVNVLRSVPERVKVTVTDELLNRRARFASLSKLVKKLTPVFIMGTLPMKPGQNYRNPATSANSNAVTVSGGQRVEIDPTLFILSKGSLGGQYATVTQAFAGAPIVATWNSNTNVGTSPSDRVYLVAYNETKEVLYSLEDDARSAEEITLPSTGAAVGDLVHFYTLVKSTNGSFWSDSQYLGNITVS